MVILLCIMLMVIVALVLFCYRQRTENRKLLTQKKKSEVSLGFISEKLAPFLENFDKSLDPKNLVFIGKPIDYIHFGDKCITFVEIKSGKAVLTKSQRSIKAMIKDKKVNWYEFKVSGTPAVIENASAPSVQQ